MMEYIRLRNGVQMPMLGMGVFQIPAEQCVSVVMDALAAGYRLIDTASSYQNEAAVGEAIARSGIPRAQLFITTKAYIHQMGYAQTMAAFETSLQNLGLDHLDLYLIHMPFGDYHGSWRALEELYAQGRVRAIGVCNFLPDRLLDLCMNAKVKPMIDQIECHPHDQRDEEIKWMKEQGVQVQAWAPFAEGRKGMFQEPVLFDIGRKHGKTPAQVILRWNLQRQVAVIPKTIHRERMIENSDIWDFTLDEEEMKAIKTLDKGEPSLLDPRKVSEVKRVYAYMDDPVLTSL